MSASNRSVTAEDQQGRRWIVYDDDTAWPLCHKLTLAGVRNLVLPSSAFLYGTVELPDNLPVVDQLPVEMVSPELKPHIFRIIRLKDCVAFLQENL